MQAQKISRFGIAFGVPMLLALLCVTWTPAGPASPLKTSLFHASVPATSPITLEVPILLYHQIGGGRSKYNLPVRDFAEQMKYLAGHGYVTVSIDQVAAALRGQRALPPCPIAITFDDGYRSAYANALPILQQFGLRATFYLVTGYISHTMAYMNWDQARNLIAKGMWVGSHSVSHPFLARLARTPAQHQIDDSKSILEAQLGISITTFAYPYGSMRPSVERAVEDAGYAAALWTGHGARQTSDQIYQMKRIGVYSPITLAYFIARLPRHGPDGVGACPIVPSS